MERNDNLTICVGRQLGSGGRTIAKMLAEQLNCRFFDRELLCLAAKESGFSEKFFEQNDEQKGFFKSLFHMHVPYVSDSHFYGTGMSQENLFKIQSDAIRKAAAQGPCVFVGRCADYILRESDNLVSIFITADVDHRVERLCERMSCSSEEALKMIEKQEAGRLTTIITRANSGGTPHLTTSASIRASSASRAQRSLSARLWRAGDEENRHHQ